MKVLEYVGVSHGLKEGLHLFLEIKDYLQRLKTKRQYLLALLLFICAYNFIPVAKKEWTKSFPIYFCKTHFNLSIWGLSPYSLAYLLF